LIIVGWLIIICGGLNILNLYSILMKETYGSAAASASLSGHSLPPAFGSAARPSYNLPIVEENSIPV
jgi:hypothetical protein